MLTYRYEGSRPTKKRVRRMKPSLRRWTEEKLLAAVRKLLEKETARYVAAEDYATELRARKDMVAHAFMVLRREGLIGAEHNAAAHDSKRDYFFKGHGSGWQATVYEVPKNLTNG